MIRKAKPDDAANVASLGFTVWVDTYATDGIRDTLSKYVFAEFSVRNIKRMISTQNVLVAEEGGHLLAYSVAEKGVEKRAELKALYVLPKFQNQGIGRELLNSARSFSANGLWLTCWQHNKSALNFYHKNGFKRCGEEYINLEGEKHLNFVLECT
jgi:ribosomal protein S18 acetylase RimI-like enzyme